VSGGVALVKENQEHLNFITKILIFFIIALSIGNIWQVYDLKNNNTNLELQKDLNILKVNDFVLAQNQGLIIDSIGNNQLCGNGEFIPDSNRLNEVPRGIVYSCFIQEAR